MKDLSSIMLNLQTHYHFQLYFQKVEQHTGGKLLIHCTKTTRTISCKDWNPMWNILEENLYMT